MVASVVLAVLASVALANPNARSHLFYLPGGSVCLKDAEQHCHQILQVCRPGHECEIQCSADHVPELSPECIKAHPCANDVELHCRDHSVTSLMSCLKANAHKLSHRCLEMEPCLTHASMRCPDGKFWVHPVTPVFHRLFPFLPSSATHEDECSCSTDMPCGDHLDHEFCQPCGPGCVQNPLCGVGRSWCVVKSKACHEPGLLPMYPHDCFGPYPHYPECSASIVHKEAELLHAKKFPKNLKETVTRRCEIQHDLSKEGKCPKVDVSAVEHKLVAYDGRQRKTCNQQPGINSFVHHFFEGLFGRHHPRHGGESVGAKLNRQENIIRSEHQKLHELETQLNDVKGAVHSHRFQTVDEGRSWWWLLIVPLSLAAIVALLYQWKSVRRV